MEIHFKSIKFYCSSLINWKPLILEEIHSDEQHIKVDEIN